MYKYKIVSIKIKEKDNIENSMPLVRNIASKPELGIKNKIPKSVNNNVDSNAVIEQPIIAGSNFE